MPAGRISTIDSRLKLVAPILICIIFLPGCTVDVYGETYATEYGPEEKVSICHKGKKTLTLPRAAVDAHLGHGDTLGPCF